MEWKIKNFEELTTNELYKILEERTRVFVVEQNCPYQECDGKDLRAFHLYAEEAGRIIAYLRILPRKVSYDEVSIGRVLVAIESRGKGIAGKMMKEALRYIKEELGENKIRISAQKYLLSFYEGLGFRAVSEVYLEDDIPHIEMLYENL